MGSLLDINVYGLRARINCFSLDEDEAVGRLLSLFLTGEAAGAAPIRAVDWTDDGDFGDAPKKHDWLVIDAPGALTGERFDGMPSAHGLAAFAYLIVFGSIIGFSAYIWLLHHVRPALAGSYAYVNPAIAVGLGAWLAGERFGAHELMAMGVILLGVVAITLAKARKTKVNA